jgi:hypothetical protein
VHLSPPDPKLSDLVAGDVLALSVPYGLVIFRVVRVKRVSAQELPVLEQLEYGGLDVPSLDLLERLPKRDFPNPTLKDLGRFHIVVMADPGQWRQLGFRKIGRIQRHEADSRRQVVYRTSRATWSHIVAYYQNPPNQVTGSFTLSAIALFMTPITDQLSTESRMQSSESILTRCRRSSSVPRSLGFSHLFQLNAKYRRVAALSNGGGQLRMPAWHAGRQPFKPMPY